MIRDANLHGGLEILLNTTPDVVTPSTLPDSITRIRGEYYRQQGWIVNLKPDKFPILEQHLANQTPVKIEDVTEENDYNSALDAHYGPNTPRTYIVRTRRGNPIGTERIAIDPQINLWQKLGDLIVLDEKYHLVNFADTTQGRILLNRLAQEQTGILDIERLVPLDPTKDIETTQFLTQFVIGSSLDQIQSLPKPLPEFSYILWWANPDQTLPESYKNIYGDDAEGVVFMKALSANQKGLLQVDDIVATRFRTQTYIDNSKKIMNAAYHLATHGLNTNLTQFNLMGAQVDAAIKVAQGLLEFGIA